MLNGALTALQEYWEYAIEHFGIPFGRYCVKLYHTAYANLTFFNVIIIKCVPTGIYMHKFIKNIYMTSRERLKQKRTEIDDIKLQIQIVNTKLKLRDAEFAERVEILRRKVEQLRKVRKRVQEIIATDDDLRNTINETSRENVSNCNVNETSEEEDKYFVELLKDLKNESAVIPEQETEIGYEEKNTSSKNCVYSSVHEDNKQDYHVKIVKITNVYKVAYLRHFIKQKKLRRANKQALLRKKMDTIKKIFDDWQQTLKMVIDNRLSLVNLVPQHIGLASQAMGDFSKRNLNGSLDSNSDCKNSADGYPDEYCVSWAQNQYTPVYNDDFNMDVVRRECYDIEENFSKYNDHEERCNCSHEKNLLAVPEETTSQIEIEEIKSET